MRIAKQVNKGANMKAKTSITIKGQGNIPLTQPKKVTVGPKHQPGYGKGKARVGGAALRGTKFNGVF